MADNTLSAVLKKYRQEKGQEFTHTSIKGGIYYIPDDKRDEFYKLYARSIKKGFTQYMTEKKTKEYGTLVIDFDFRKEESTLKENEKPKRDFQLQHIIEICDKMKDFLKDFLPPSANLTYFISQRNGPRIEKGKIKDGVHIQFPYLKIRYTLQHYLRFSMMGEVDAILEPCGYSNNIEDIYDEAVIEKNNWLMYKSTKPGLEPYDIVYPDVSSFSLEELVKIMSIHNDILETEIIPEKEEHLQNFLNTIFKDKGKQKNKKYNQFVNSEISSQEEEAIQSLIAQKYTQWPSQNIIPTSIKKKISGLDIYYFVRLSHRDPEKKVICPFKGEPHARDTCPVFIQITKSGMVMKCNDDGPVCSGKIYPTVGVPIPDNIGNVIFNQANFTIVNNYAQDEPVYKKELFENDVIHIFDDNQCNELLKIGLSMTHYDMAKLLYHMYKDDYIFAGNNWYEFYDHRWHMKKIPSLKKKISEELQTYYEKLNSHYENNYQITVDERNEKTKIIHNLIKKLKDAPYKKNVMSEVADFFENEDFINLADENKYLLAFNNGVFDFEKMEFREGKKDDWITLCTYCDYVDYDENNTNIKEVQDFLYKLLPHYEKREYTMKLIASCLSGHTFDEKFHLWTGTASNGKSKFTELISESLGDYSFSLPIALITQKRQNANSANPEMAKTKGKRFGYLQEPDKGDEIRVGLMKEITGGDKISTRKLYGEPFEFKPQFKLILCCNDLPKIPSSDQGTWRRLRVIAFSSKFVDNPDPDNPNEFKKDTSISQKVKIWSSHFVAILIEYFRKYKKEGLIEPEEIMKFTKEYESENDKYSEFINDYIVKDSKGALKWTTVLEFYTKWYRKNYTDERMERAKDIKRNFETFLGDKVKTVRHEEKIVKGWKGFDIKYDEEEVQDNDFEEEAEEL